MIEHSTVRWPKTIHRACPAALTRTRPRRQTRRAPQAWFVTGEGARHAELGLSRRCARVSVSLSSAGVSANFTSNLSGAGLSGRVGTVERGRRVDRDRFTPRIRSPHRGPRSTGVFLHGFPSSSYDWRVALDCHGERATLAFDFFGFVLTDR